MRAWVPDCVFRVVVFVVLDFSVRFASFFCFAFGLERVEEFVVDTTFVESRFVVLRMFSAPTQTSVWNTDRPRHTAKNSIILFIP